MYISNITLRDWKVYTSATFEFPVPSKNANIVLIGAANGYGKTSLFEAVVLGIFGKEGLPLIGRSLFTGADKKSFSESYGKFLEKALYSGALAAGRTSCSVKLAFMNDDGVPLEIERIWHFDGGGRYRPSDEEIQIYEGSERKPVGPSNVSDNERNDWFRDYIAENLLPFTLAHFFMFDGEQVSILAEMEMSSQVSSGIEGLLGIPMLRKLANDLRDYAEARRKEAPRNSDQTMERLANEQNDLISKRDRKAENLAEIEPLRTEAKKRRDALIRELMSFGADSQGNLRDKFETINQYKIQVENEESQVEDLLMKGLALALCGAGLREDVKQQLNSEGVRERWENAKSQGDENLENFINAIRQSMKGIKPELNKAQRESVIVDVKAAWVKLWYPPPEDCADEYFHPYLNQLGRGKVYEFLDEVDSLRAPEVSDLLASIEDTKGKLAELQNEALRLESAGPEVETKQKELEETNKVIEDFDQQIGALKREIESLGGLIDNINADLAKISGQVDQAAPSVRRTARAARVAHMVDEIVKQAVPSQIEAIATAMTEAHHSMAHKKDQIDRIEIDKNLNVKLLNSKNIDLRQNDLSAGEKQIFTQSLFSAITSVSGRGFPMVVDTPLGRLDEKHRKGVLNHLVQRKHQVILLSTDTEVVGEYLDVIEPHVQKKYLVEFEQAGETGQSRVRLGYFDEMGAS